jgi:glucose/mannose transport system substrate-binding protein
MRTGSRLVLALVLFVLAARFSSAAPPDKTTAPIDRAKTLTLYHWWVEPYELEAVDALVHLFEKKYPGVTVTAAEEPGGGKACMGLFPVLRALVRAGKPPDAFQMHPGYESQCFVDAQLLGATDALWASEGLEKVIPAVVQNMCKSEGHFYSVPVGIHRTNVVWYNKALLDKQNIDPGSLTTWDAFFAAADKLRSAGLASPVETGPGWLVAHVFECIMAGQGMTAYEDWINGKITAADDPRLVRTLSILARYLSYTDKTDDTSSEALKRVVSGRAAFCINGDWAERAFRRTGMKYGKDYGNTVVPGTNGMYGLTIDTFQRPAGIPDTTNSDRWLKVVVSREGQDAFNTRKGSIPARTDTDTTLYDAYQKSAMADFRAARSTYPSAGIGVPESYKLRYQEIMAAFAKDRDVNKAASALSAATAAVASKYKRVWSLQ